MIIQLSDKQKQISKPEDVYKVLQALLVLEDEVDREKEHFWVFQLDTRHRIKALELVSLGILNASLVHPREVFTRAIASLCNGILVAHNHPSGDPTPSQDDLLITKRLKDAGILLDIPLIDHIICTEDNFLSFKDQGLI
ncbi:MAG: DNA repair protein RadC [Anaerolineae bacterium]|nr:DNA repair protein RadC [Anaerolineae bacterium]